MVEKTVMKDSYYDGPVRDRGRILKKLKKIFKKKKNVVQNSESVATKLECCATTISLTLDNR